MALDYESIVTNTESPTLVLAGPGAGKTHLLSDRVVRLLSSGASSTEITVLTFGKDASLNMREELLSPSGHWQLPAADLPRIATLHSLGFEIVNESPRTVGLRKADLAVQPVAFVSELIYRDAAYIQGYTRPDGDTARSCKAEGNCVPSDESARCAICSKYWDIMAKCDRIDFDDQILFACRILERKPDILRTFQARAKHLLVDEYQDINAAQHKLIELLSQPNRTGLFAVGDDAQSIYGFRGTSPCYILDFREHYPDAITPPLPHSWRCHENILRTAEKVLTANYKKWTGPFDLTFHRDIDDMPYVWQMPSEATEATMVAKLAKKYSSVGQSVLILAPKKELFAGVTKKLTQYGVPHVCPVSLLPKHTERRMASLSTFAKWVQEPQSNFLTRLTLETALNGGVAKVPGATHSAALKPETIERRSAVESEVAMLWEGVNKQTNLYEVLCGTEGMSKALEKVRDVMSGTLGEYQRGSKSQSAEFLKLSALATGAWIKPDTFVNDINRLLVAISDNEVAANDKVRLMTMRKAKGLQADVVIMIGLEDDIMPNPMSNPEEEARIFYVSMTRAKKKLFMLHAFKRPRDISYGPEIMDKPRSRFLSSIDIDSEYKRIRA